MKKITSPSNELIKHVIQLHSAKGRAQHQQFIAQGIRTCITLINAGHDPVHVYITDNQHDFVTQFPLLSYIYVTDALMKKMSTNVTPPGIIAVFSIPKVILPDTFSHSGLVLNHLADPGNVGTLMRTAAALNITTVLIIGGVDPWSPKVVQASVGTIGMLTLYRLSWDECIKRKGSLSFIALVPSGGKDMQEIKAKHSFLIVGNEAHGIAPDVLADCDTTLSLPMPGNTESLNAAIAGSIALYLNYYVQTDFDK